MQRLGFEERPYPIIVGETALFTYTNEWKYDGNKNYTENVEYW